MQQSVSVFCIAKTVSLAVLCNSQSVSSVLRKQCLLRIVQQSVSVFCIAETVSLAVLCNSLSLRCAADSVCCCSVLVQLSVCCCSVLVQQSVSVVMRPFATVNVCCCCVIEQKLVSVAAVCSCNSQCLLLQCPCTTVSVPFCCDPMR